MILLYSTSPNVHLSFQLHVHFTLKTNDRIRGHTHCQTIEAIKVIMLNATVEYYGGNPVMDCGSLRIS